MLIKCPECQAEISSDAPACPHCGKPAGDAFRQAFAPAATQTIETAPGGVSKPERAQPGFELAAIAALVFSLFTPRLIIVIPLLATVVLSIVSIIRKEKWPAISVVTLVGAVLLFMLGEVPTNTPTSMPTQSLSPTQSNTDNAIQYAQIADWNWHIDRDFGTHGTIKWTVVVRNISDRPISMAKVGFTSYDQNGHVLGSTFTFVHAIPPHDTRSEDSYADLFGTEAKATVQLQGVEFEGQ